MSAVDVVVAGLGAMGSATAWQLARRGLRVVGLDRFAPPHALGSSHGRSRIIREAYFEDPCYVPIVQRAYALWDELADESGSLRLHATGGLMIGPADGVLVSGALASARAHALAHRVVDAAALRREWPVFAAPDDVVGVWEPRAGVLEPEGAVADFLALARRRGAELRFGEPLLGWREAGGGIEAMTSSGAFRAGALVLAAGPWMPRLVPQLGLTVERNLQYWFEPAAHAGRFALGRMPVFIWEHARGRFFYGFPAVAGAPKVARHGEGTPHEPDAPAAPATPEEIEAMRAILRRTIPDLDGPFITSAACLYTNAPDGHFRIGRLPGPGRVVVASPCSGHGFKFAPAIGELLADLATGVEPRFDLSRFALETAGGGPS